MEPELALCNQARDQHQRTGTPNQPQNLQPTVCLAVGWCWVLSLAYSPPENRNPSADRSRCKVPQSDIQVECRESCEGGEGKIVGARGIKGTTRSGPTDSTDWYCSGLTEIRELVGSDLGRLCICNGCVAWCSCRILNSGSGVCP